MSDDNLNRAIALSRSGKKSEARELLKEILRANPQNETAWLWFADTFSDIRNRIAALEECLKFNPNCQAAQRGLAALKIEETRTARATPPQKSEMQSAQIAQLKGFASESLPGQKPSQKPKTKQSAKNKRPFLFLGSVFGIIVLFSICILGAWILHSQGMLSFPLILGNLPSLTPTQTNTLVPAFTLTTTIKPTITLSPTPRDTATPRPTNTPRPPTNTPQPTITPTPSFLSQTAKIGPIYDPLHEASYTMEITVRDMKWLNADGYKKPKPGNIFLVVYLTAKNLGPSAVDSFGPFVFQVLDANGIVHDYDILPSTMDTCHLEYVDIIPNGALEGCVAYEVPKAGKLEFIYAPYQYEGLKPGRYLSFIVRP